MWEIAYIMPNLKVSTVIESENIALVPYDDERIEVIKNEQIGASKLLDGFIDDFNNPIKPAALIIKNSGTQDFITIDSIVAFRNVVTISTILLNWALDYSQGSALGPLFSNSFRTILIAFISPLIILLF